MKEKQTQFLVLGLGKFGESVARSLCEMGREVLAVDSDPAIVEAVAPYVTQAVQADVTEEAALSALGAGEFDVAVVSTGDVRSSILVVMMLKEQGVKKVVAKALDELHGKVLLRVGADRVVFPERETGLRVAKALVTPGIMDLMQLTPDHEIVEVTPPEKWAGHTIGSLDVRRRWGLNILALRRNGDFIVSPTADTVIQPGDFMLVLGKTDDVQSLQ